MLLRKSVGEVSQSQVQSSSEKASPHLKPLNIRVHFECDEHKFPMRIITNNFDHFYDKVVSTFHNKIPGFKSHCMQFLCGKKWYKFDQSTGFDALCLDEDDPEITVQATIMSPEEKHLGNYIIIIDTHYANNHCSC